MKSITDLENLNNQIVLLRLDLNVPILDGKITDTNRIDKIIPTINFLLSKKAKIIIISHVGRPKGKCIRDRRKRLTMKNFLNIWQNLETFM